MVQFSSLCSQRLHWRKKDGGDFNFFCPVFLPVISPWNAHTSIMLVWSQARDTSLISIVLAVLLEIFSPVKSFCLSQNTLCILKWFLLHLWSGRNNLEHLKRFAMDGSICSFNPEETSRKTGICWKMLPFAPLTHPFTWLQLTRVEIHRR